MNDFFLADDLSGALDAGAAFHGAGRPVTIALSMDAALGPLPAETVIGFTTETRNAPPAEAAAVVGREIEHGRREGARLLFKKIDSTLRGPVAAEVAALAAALPAAQILFTPANPAAGRTVRDGVLLVRGVPVAETEFGRDPVSPVRESAIRRLLDGTPSNRLMIADASSEADLIAAVRHIAAHNREWVAVGSGALARAVASQLPARAAMRPSPGQSGMNRAPVLFVSGSAHPANQQQAARLAQSGDAVRHEVSLAEPERAAVLAIATLREKKFPVLHLPPRDVDRVADIRAALAAIVRATMHVIRATGVRRLMITGGETAFAFAHALGIESLDIRAEIEPGLVVAEARTREDSWTFAIKPGGFGDSETWLRAHEYLRGM